MRVKAVAKFGENEHRAEHVPSSDNENWYCLSRVNFETYYIVQVFHIIRIIHPPQWWVMLKHALRERNKFFGTCCVREASHWKIVYAIVKHNFPTERKYVRSIELSLNIRKNCESSVEQKIWKFYRVECSSLCWIYFIFLSPDERSIWVEVSHYPQICTLKINDCIYRIFRTLLFYVREHTVTHRYQKYIYILKIVIFILNETTFCD